MRYFSLRLFSILGIAIICTIVILACGDESTPTTLRTTVTPSATATPSSATATVASGQPVAPRLKVAVPPPAHQVTLPHKTTGSGGGPLRTMYNFLIWNDRFTNEYKPMLATEWSIGSDAMSWTYQLRKDVTFHDGSEFTSKDVRRSFDITILPDSLVAGAGEFRQKVKTADNIDISKPHEVVFKTVEPWLTMDFTASEDRTFYIYSADHWDRVGEQGYSENPIGTGPFKFKELKIGSHLLVERFKKPGENHWWKIPEFDEIQLLYVPEEATRMAMLLAGEAHMSELSGLLMDEVKTKGYVASRSTLPGQSFFFIFGGLNFPEKFEYNGTVYGDHYNPDNPFLDIKVREALNIAIDREQIRKTFFGERAIDQTVHLFPPNRQPYNSNWKPYPYDPDRAKRLLAEAGYPQGLTFDMPITLNIPGISEAPNVAEAVAGMWLKIGVKANLVPTEYGELAVKSGSYGFDGAIYNMAINSALTVGLGWEFGLFGGGTRTIIWQDPLLRDLYVDQYRKELNPTRRMELELQFGNRMYDNYAIIPLYWIYSEVALDPNVVAEYQANMLFFGATRHLEFAKPVYK
jgi:peptide/nickel transport system substrate-binding protein